MRNQKFKTYKISTSVLKKDYLAQILIRLESEYIKILELITEYNLNNERGIGFWSSIRIIFPVIETVAAVVGKKKEDFIEEDLKVPYGHIVWMLYRHALMHSDELRFGSYKGKTISWATHLGNNGLDHFVAPHTQTHPITIHLSIPQLYYRLQSFLIEEIKKNENTHISVQRGIGIDELEQNSLTDELNEIIAKY